MQVQPAGSDALSLLSLLPLLLLWIALNGGLVRALSRSDGRWRAELGCLFLAQAAAAWLVSAFFTSGQIGA